MQISELPFSRKLKKYLVVNFAVELIFVMKPRAEWSPGHIYTTKAGARGGSGTFLL